MTVILGISAFYHDSAAALVVDGKIVAAAQEERFTRKRHDESFPTRAIEYCLKEAGLAASQIDHVGFYEKPLRTFDRLLETYLAFAPSGFRSFSKAMPMWLKEKLFIPRTIRKGLGGEYKGRLVFTSHHESHAASAFFPSPFEEAAILTMDGVGEWATSSIGVGRGNRMTLTHEQRFPHSLGLLYTAFTYFTGFKVNSGEYKLMGLAPYGKPIYAETMFEHLLDLKDDGSFRVDLSYFNYCQGLTMTSSKMDSLFGGPARTPESPITQREMDIAASIQMVTEEVMLRSAVAAHKLTGCKNLVMAGGVALNCVGNGRILRDGPFDNVWIQPAAGDAGGALGVALLIWHQLLDNPRVVAGGKDLQSSSALGPQYDQATIHSYLDSIGAVYEAIDDEDKLCAEVAEIIDNKQVVGWMQGRMEYGPRALGNRSILGDPRSAEMQSTINLKIKFRESFRPFAPSIKAERTDEFFDLGEGHDSPYMLVVAPVAEAQRLAPSAEAAKLEGLDALKFARSTIPAVTHVDYSARVQTVAEDHGRYFKLLRAFEERTGCPILINTSFNVRGEPIVCTPQDAFRCFMATDMDVLVIEKTLLRKSKQPTALTSNRDRYLTEFALD